MPASSLYAVVLCLALVRFAQDRLMYGRRLSEDAYRRTVLLWSWARDWRIALPTIAMMLPAAMAPAETSWTALGEFSSLRWFAAACIASLAWSYSTYEPNRFLGQVHRLDRAVLVALGLMALVHPVAIVPFVAHLMVMARQFELPTCFLYSLTPLRLPLDLLMIMAAWPMAVVLIAPSPAILVVLLLSAAGALYAIPAVHKALIGPVPGIWAIVNRTHRLFVSSYQQGWLSRFSPHSILRAARVIAALDRPIGIITLLLELAAALMLLGREAAIVVLLANVLLHTAILLSSGINFWKWAVADIALAAALVWMPESALTAVFRPEHLPVALAIIATHSVHLRCPRLGWLDTPWNNHFVIEAVGHSGRVYRVPRSFFTPFDIIFAQDRHYYLVSERLLVGTYGVTIGTPRAAWRLCKALEATRGDPAALEAVRQKHGRIEYNERAALEFDRFMQEFFAAFNRECRAGAVGRSRTTWSRFAPPLHIWSMWRGADVFAAQESVARIRVRLIETWANTRAITTITDRVVREVLIEDQAAEPLARAA